MVSVWLDLKTLIVFIVSFYYHDYNLICIVRLNWCEFFLSHWTSNDDHSVQVKLQSWIITCWLSSKLKSSGQGTLRYEHKAEELECECHREVLGWWLALCLSWLLTLSGLLTLRLSDCWSYSVSWFLILYMPWLLTCNYPDFRYVGLVLLEIVGLVLVPIVGCVLV